MDTLLHVGLSNAVAACVLAAIAALVGRFGRRPALSHALWLLVLVKLVTPPLVDVPVPWPQENAPVPVAETAPEPPPEVAVLPAEEPAAAVEFEPADAVVALPPEPVDETPSPPVVTNTIPEWLTWRLPILAVWIGGALVWTFLAGRRAWNFARCLRFASPASASLRTEVARLARRLELPEPPEVLLLPGRISPMVWGVGRAPRLLLPTELLARLDDESRQTLLVHELAHLRRRDQRVRLFELLVTALFWWHPVVWLARRELREAEEQCCDAWVLWALPRYAKTYALALVETVDFLSETQAALPPVASGIGPVHDLRRRVTMIMQGTTPRTLSWGGLLALLGTGAFLLPVMPTWAQQPTPERQDIHIIRFGEESEKPMAPAKDAEIQKLTAELAKKRAEIVELEAKLKAMQAGKKPADTEKREILMLELRDGKAIPIKSGEQGKIVIDLNDFRIVDDTKAKPEAVREIAADAEREKRVRLEAMLRDRLAQTQSSSLVIEVVIDGKKQMIQLPPGSRIITPSETKPVPTPPRGLTPPPAETKPEPNPVPVPPVRNEYFPPREGAMIPPPVTPGEPRRVRGSVETTPVEADKRVADLEKKLADMARELEGLRRDLKAKPTAPLPSVIPIVPPPVDPSRR